MSSVEQLQALVEEQQEQIEKLERKQATLQEQYQAAKEQNEQVLDLFDQFKSGRISRRAFLTSISAVAGISWLAGSAEAAPNWSNAAGNSGTESKPLSNVYAKNAIHQSVSTDESVTITDDDTIAYGRDHGATVQGNNVVVGVGARALEDVNQTISGNDPRKVVVGFGAAKNDEQFGVTAAGYRAARDNTGSNLTAAGYQAAQDNTGDRVTAAGHRAAEKNTGNNLTAAGYKAALNNTGFGVTAAGHRAARGDGLADPTTMGDNNIGLGQNAIRNNQASGLIAIGQDAGINAQTDDQLIITQRDGTRRMVMDLTTGDLSITGSLTENASL